MRAAASSVEDGQVLSDRCRLWSSSCGGATDSSSKEGPHEAGHDLHNISTAPPEAGFHLCRHGSLFSPQLRGLILPKYIDDDDIWNAVEVVGKNG